MECREERGFPLQRQHSLLNHGTLDVVVLDNDIFLEHLDGKALVGALQLC